MEDEQNHQAAMPAMQPNGGLPATPPRKSKKEASPEIRPEPYDYTGLGLKPEEINALESIAVAVLAIGRRSTDETFTLGEQLHVAAEMIPKGTFGNWVESKCNVTRQQATKWINIGTRLQPYKKRLVTLGIPATTMGVLAANLDHVEHVLGEYETGRWLTGDDVKALLGMSRAKPKTAEELADAGGIVGLRNLAKAKANMGIGRFAERVTTMLQDIEEALKPAEQGKRVLKGALAKKIEIPARFARAELANIALFIEPNTLDSTSPHIMKFPAGSKWGELVRLLWHLGDQAQWKSEMVPWLTDHVVPLLKWAVSNGKQAAADAS